MRSQAELFEWKPEGDWKPDPVLPDLTNFHSFSLDTEYGIRGRKQILAGISLKTPDGKKRYLPVGHEGGGNLDPDQVKRWAKGELRNKRIVGLNIGNDGEVIRDWGVDLEAQGNTLHDIAHSASLLNEYRRSGFSLDSLGKEYAGRGKMESPVDKGRIAESHSSMIGPYAEEDAALTWDVDEIQQLQIQKESLGRVQDLEDRLIWVNNHIERNGARLDLEKLNLWRGLIRSDYSNAMIELSKSPALPFNFSPNASKKWAKLFQNLGIPAHYAEDTGAESYDAAFLKTCTDPTVKLAFQAKKLNSLLSKYFDKYAVKRSTRSGLLHMTGDLLHFTLHQLRSGSDAGDDDSADGTVSGRYSSADVNIQQVMQVEKQIEEFGDQYIVREIFIPDEGFDFFAGDASQIEFRLFAHYSKDRDLIAQYNNDPNIDFHMLVTKMLNPSVLDPKELKRLRPFMKHNNFGKLYGMGIEKLARRLGLNCNCGVTLSCKGCDLPGNNWQHYEECGRNRDAHCPDCPAVAAMDIVAKYDREFPAARKLSKEASKTAKQRGYVTTILGRKQRFPHGDRLHSALNRIIQGSAADVFKMKLLMLYENRHTIGIHKLRQPVHDESTGDIERSEQAHKRLKEAFADTEIRLRVPTLWDVGFGKNWREAKGK